MIRRTAGFLAVCLVLGAAATAAKASTTITFDDLPGDGSSVPNGYNNLDWDNFDSLNGGEIVPSGYNNGTVSSPNVIYNGYGQEAMITSDTPFTFDSADFTAAWNNGLSITVTGLLDGLQVDTSTFVVNTTSPSLESFGWSNINELDFISSGGTSAGYGGSGTHFAMDNLTIGAESPVPEPPSALFLATGLLALFGSLKLARRVTA